MEIMFCKKADVKFNALGLLQIRPIAATSTMNFRSTVQFFTEFIILLRYEKGDPTKSKQFNKEYANANALFPTMKTL